MLDQILVVTVSPETVNIVVLCISDNLEKYYLAESMCRNRNGMSLFVNLWRARNGNFDNIVNRIIKQF